MSLSRGLSLVVVLCATSPVNAGIIEDNPPSVMSRPVGSGAWVPQTRPGARSSASRRNTESFQTAVHPDDGAYIGLLMRYSTLLRDLLSFPLLAHVSPKDE